MLCFLRAFPFISFICVEVVVDILSVVYVYVQVRHKCLEVESDVKDWFGWLVWLVYQLYLLLKTGLAGTAGWSRSCISCWRLGCLARLAGQEVVSVVEDWFGWLVWLVYQLYLLLKTGLAGTAGWSRSCIIAEFWLGWDCEHDVGLETGRAGRDFARPSVT